MKKTILALGVILMSLSATHTAYAGSLNQYESEVMGAARGQFEYNGEKYKLDSGYLNRLNAYLTSDGVDLTKEQSNGVLQSINAYVETGVKEGYLISVQGQKSQGDSNKEGSSFNTDASNDTYQNKDTEANSKTEDSSHGGLSRIDKPSQDNKEETDLSAPAQTDNTNGNIIKNTGFNLDRSVFTAFAMIVLMITGMVSAIKNNFFAQTDE